MEPFCAIGLVGRQRNGRPSGSFMMSLNRATGTIEPDISGVVSCTIADKIWLVSGRGGPRAAEARSLTSGRISRIAVHQTGVCRWRA